MRQILRVMVALCALAALSGGGTVAFADHGSGGSSGSGSGDEHGGQGPRPATTTAARTPATTTPVTMPATIAERSHSQATTAASTTAPARPPTIARPTSTRWPTHNTGIPRAWPSTSAAASSSSRPPATAASTAAGSATPRRRCRSSSAGAAGQSATGLKVAHGKLYAAGASTGTIKVYDVDGGALLATFDTKGGDSSPTFVNDLDVTKRGDIYATDSKRPAIYHLTAEEIAAGTPAPKPIDPADVISTSPEIPFNAAPAAFNLNGIVVGDDRGDDAGRHHGDRHRRHGDRRADKLIVVDSDTGQLFTVKVGRDGNAARKIRELAVAGGPFKGGDGLLIDRGRLLVVQGSNPDDGFPNGVVDFIDVRRGGRDGRLADQRTDSSFQGPSTIARARDRYLVVNPDFATSTPPFTVTALPR